MRPVLSQSELIKEVSSILGIEPDLVRHSGKRRSLAEARGMICYVGVREFGYTEME